jgi:hypothetical protein
VVKCIPILLIPNIFCCCGLKVPPGFINKVHLIPAKQITAKVLEAYYNNKIDSATDVNRIPDETTRRQLLKLKISIVRISFWDSVVSYERNDKHLSIRLRPLKTITSFYYDFAYIDRDLSTYKGFWNSGDKKVGERTYVNKIKLPGIR